MPLFNPSTVQTPSTVCVPPSLVTYRLLQLRSIRVPIKVLKTVPDQRAYILSAMARTDYLSGNTTFRDTVLNSIGDTFKLNPTILTCVHNFFIFIHSVLTAFPLYVHRVSLAGLFSVASPRRRTDERGTMG